MISKNKNLAIKYALGFQSILPEYPTLEDIEFEILDYIIKPNQSNFNDLKFSNKTLKYIFGNRLEDKEFTIKIINSIKKLLEKGSFYKNSEYIFITEETVHKFYTIT